MSAEEKGKTKVLSVVGLERIVKVEDPVVMPVGREAQRKEKEEMVQDPARRRERPMRAKM